MCVPGPGTNSSPAPMVSPPTPPTPPNLGRKTSLRPSFFFPSFLLLSLLPFFFPSFLSPFPPSFLLPFPFSFLPFPPSFEVMSAAHHHHRGRRCFATRLQSSKLHLFIKPFLLLIFSLNPFCFYVHPRKLDICSYNLYRALVMHIIPPHHTTGGRGGTMTIGGEGGPCGL